MGKLLAYESGGDWVDAGVEYMVNVSGKTGAELFKEYTTTGGYEKHRLHFYNWCIKTGYCKDVTDDDIDIVQNC